MAYKTKHIMFALLHIITLEMCKLFKLFCISDTAMENYINLDILNMFYNVDQIKIQEI